MFYTHEKLALVVDGHNLHYAAKELGRRIDYKRLLDVFACKGHLHRATYVNVTAAEGDHCTLRNLLDFVQFNGWHAVTKPARVFQDEYGQERTKGSIDVLVAMEAVRLASMVDHIVLFSGNGDLVPVVKYLQDSGRRVTVVSSVQASMVSKALRRQADTFIDLADLADAIADTREMHAAE
ncbi:LabA-like NYN domain-containing protein [Epibacterium ulvae]|uniref:LabA-like NYN domain-containing protein n=1 Tax=Epibacterium ulvae TaxID=1156985 RepID=UPI0024929780|nr:NYN domain-containing protein [Epibacterium ulvae]